MHIDIVTYHGADNGKAVWVSRNDKVHAEICELIVPLMPRMGRDRSMVNGDTEGSGQH